MAADSIVGEVSSNLISTITGSVLWVGIAFLVIGAIAFTIWYLFIHKRKFDITLRINSQRADGQRSVIFDKAAILFDKKSKDAYLRMWKTKFDMPEPPFGIIQKTPKGDFIDMYKDSENRIAYMNSPTVDNQWVMQKDGKKVPMADQKAVLVDMGDAYWRARKNEENKSMFDRDKLIWKLLEMAPQIVSSVLMLFVVWIFMDKLPAVLGQLEDLSRTIASSQRADVVYGFIPLAFLKWKK